MKVDPAMAAEILEFLGQRFGRGPSPPEVDTDLLRDWILDSLDLTHVILFLEERFEVRIERRDLTPANFRTVAGMCRFVHQKRGEP